MARYIAVYGAGPEGNYETDAAVLEDAGIDFERNDTAETEAVVEQYGSGAAELVFADEEAAHEAAEYVFVVEADEDGLHRIGGAASLRW